MAAEQDDNGNGAMSAGERAAFIEMLCRDIAKRHPNAIGEADLTEIRQQITAQFRDAEALRAIPLANSDEPAFAVALMRPQL